MTLDTFIKEEINRANLDKNTEVVLKNLTRIFSEQDHSGLSASLTRSIFVNKVLNNDLTSIFKNNGDDQYSISIVECVNELIQTLNDNINKVDNLKQLITLFDKLVSYQPIKPLTFENDEWIRFTKNNYQNKRNPAVFKKGKNGKPYYINAFYMYNKEKGSWNGLVPLRGKKYLSKAYIKNPAYMPTIRIDMMIQENGAKEWKFVPTDLNHPAIKELQKYYELNIEEIKE